MVFINIYALTSVSLAASYCFIERTGGVTSCERVVSSQNVSLSHPCRSSVSGDRRTGSSFLCSTSSTICSTGSTPFPVIYSRKVMIYRYRKSLALSEFPPSDPMPKSHCVP
ncbi:hypothetical protein ARMGADRAFT_377310 [Armillaria gallica]|uniref:Secreted protein n=1 Tax=Armillaria gallica TaxID=47427 RepID=A0A2H3EN29_ARMGA|nr:hypothetical protein ARMGADRAFT_377310 [Armillaria gallica]